MREVWEDALREIRGDYLREAAVRLEDMTHLLDGLDSDRGDSHGIEELHRRFHAFAGSGGIYGFPQVSARARVGEAACAAVLRAGRSSDPDELSAWRRLLAEIRDHLDREEPGESPTPRARVPEARKRWDIVVVDDDEAILAAFSHLLTEEGMGCRVARCKAEAVEALKRLPHGVLVDIRLPDGSGYELVEHVRSLPGGGETAVLMVSVLRGFVDKVEAIHCGADGYFEKPLDMEALMRRLEHLLGRHLPQPRRVLSVEDDPDQRRFLKVVLESAGYEVRLCSDPSRFEAEMTAFNPDVVLLDVLLPGTSGYDLARFLRQDERWAATSIVFLTTERRVSDRIEAARAGGDDHLVKPVPPSLLLSMVSARVERSRFLRSLLTRDGLTRLLTHTAFLERAREAHARARRHAERPATWVMIDLDRFKAVNDRHGHPTGDRVLTACAALLRRRVRQADTVGRYGGEEFAILLDDLGEADAVRLVERLLREFAALEHSAPDGESFRVTFSAGVAGLDPKAMSLDDWRRAADAALYAAKQAGRNCVQTASGLKDARRS